MKIKQLKKIKVQCKNKKKRGLKRPLANSDAVNTGKQI